MALSERDRRAIVMGAIGLGLIAAYMFAVEPLAKAYDRWITEHDHLAARLARTVRDNRKAEYFTSQIAEFEQTAGVLVPPAPYSEQITTVGEQIMTAAQAGGVSLRGSTPTAPVPWAEDPSLEVALLHIDAESAWPGPPAASGAWENIFKFIAGLYRIPGVLSVEQLDLSSDAKKGGSDGGKQGGKITMRLSVSVLVASGAKGETAWSK